MERGGAAVGAAAGLEELDQAYEQRVSKAARRILQLVEQQDPRPLQAVVLEAVSEFDPALVRDALSLLVYEGTVVLTEDRHLSAHA